MILQIIPCFHEMYAVSAGLSGTVKFDRVTCIALAEHNETEQRVVACMIPSVHMVMADARPEHVGYAHNTDPAPWVDICRTKRATLDALAAEAAKNAGKPQLYVPNKKVVTAKDLAN